MDHEELEFVLNKELLRQLIDVFGHPDDLNYLESKKNNPNFESVLNPNTILPLIPTHILSLYLIPTRRKYTSLNKSTVSIFRSRESDSQSELKPCA